MDRLLIILLAGVLTCSSGWSQQPPPGEPGEGPGMGGSPTRRKRFNPMEEKELRERLQTIIRLPKEEIMSELQNWPRFQKMSLDEQGRFLSRIQEMKEHQRGMAKMKAEELGLKLTSKAMEQFELRLAEKRIAMAQKIQEKVEPFRQQMEQQIDQDLRSEFGGGVGTTPSPHSP